MISKKTLTRALSLALSFAVLVTSVVVGISVINAIGEEPVVKNYYALKGVKSTYTVTKDGVVTDQFWGEKPVENPWFFEARDYSTQMPFLQSGENFAAPAVQISGDMTAATVTYTAISGANNYRVDVYNVQNGQYVFRNSVESSNTSVTVADLVYNTRMAVQVVAMNGSTVVDASEVIEFPLYNRASNYIILNDGSDAATVTADGNYGTWAAISGVSPNGDCLYATSLGTNWKRTRFKLNASAPITGVKAVVFWMDLEEDTKSFMWHSDTPQLLTSAGTPITGIINNNPKNTQLKFTLISSVDGSVTTASNSDGRCVIPAGFKGYVLFPVINDTYDFSTIDMLDMMYNGWGTSPSAGFKNTKIYIDSIGVIKDVDAFINPPQNRTFAVDTTTIFDCSEYTQATNYLYNSTINVGYTLNNSPSERALRFGLKDTGTKQLGMSLRFTSPSDKIYDLGSALSLIGNSAAGTVYYRVLKSDINGNETKIWPEEGNWYELKATAANLNPTAAIDPVQVALAKDESIRIEAYGKADSSAGGTFPIRIGSPVVTIATITPDSKGSSAVYHANDYHFAARTDGSGGYVPVSDRWNLEVLDMTSGSPAVLPCTTYMAGWDKLLHGVGTNGYHSQTDNIQVEIKPTRGVSLRFVVPDDGVATVNTSKNTAATTYFRILKNEEVIYPRDGGWDNSAIAKAMASCNVVKGDEVIIQTYTTTVNATFHMGDVKVTVSSKDFENRVDNQSFAALLERPYGDSNYNGDYTAPSAAVWGFDILDGANSLAVLPANSYNAGREKFLFNSAAESAGYHFLQNELQFNLQGTNNAEATAGYGMSLKFICPDTKRYDLSTALRIIRGQGTVRYRVTKNGTAVWPADGTWYAFNEGTGSVPAIELSAAAGDVLRFEAVAVSTAQNGDTVRIGLGSPIIRKVSSIVDPKGYYMVYALQDFAPYVDKGYKGSYIPTEARWNYEVLNVNSNTVMPVNSYDTTTTNFLYQSDKRVGYHLTESGVNIQLKATSTQKYGVSMRFTSPMSGIGVINTGTLANASGQYRIFKNNEVLKNWENLTNDGIRIENVNFVKGDVVTLQFSSNVDALINVGNPSISILGDHQTGNQPGDSAFYALNANPYGRDNYTGTYVAKDYIWNFDILNGTTKEVASCDTYNSSNQRFLFSSTMNSAGYHFGDTAMSVELKHAEGQTPYGVSMEFLSPADTAYNLQSSIDVLGIKDSTVQADLHIRITKNGQKVWPETDDWFVKSMSGDESVKIPMLEFETSANDSIRFEIYATDIKKDGAAVDTLRVNMGTPIMWVSPATAYTTTDVTAKVYAAGNYNPYGTTSYDGTNKPVEGRWNFEILDVANDYAVIPADYYKRSWDHFMYHSSSSTGYHLRESVTAELKLKDDKSYGISTRFVSPLSGDVIITGKPTISGTGNEGAIVNFRILVNDTVIYPKDGGWEKIEPGKGSNFSSIAANLKQGDEVIYQTYCEGKSVNIGLGNPSIIVLQNVTKVKNDFSAARDFTPTYQLNPFWKYEYSLNAKNPVFRTLESYSGWGYWLVSGLEADHYLGVSSQRMWIYNGQNGKPHGIASYTFTAPKDAYVKMPSTKITTQADSAKARITLNDEVIWPTDKAWTVAEKSVTMDPFIFQIKKGDVLRFQGTLSESVTQPAWSSYISWNPRFTLHDSDPTHSSSKDIYSGLDAKMLAYFKSLGSSQQFDLDYLLNKAAAEAEADDDNQVSTDVPDDTSTVDSDTSSETSEVSEPDETSPSDQGDNSSGGKKKTIKTIVITYGLPTWAIVLISIGGVFIIGGVVLLILIKKGKIQLRKKETEDQ